ncbi:hypothetical protein CHLRE_03g143767v5 [Chlamydomonas reinhardtii]|uniref:Secreted protein n=1 Tax=Chlamydomonas reinhardtii TaxID=3055 RepID=A0A2K3DV36_CHLRE|nr:uncharacterized protein CHLRE_03g143767v5 [Chlamydomonas reinhardtii]PNW84374.1 hypothetical protein CHLRE_03g143767v5 [Chlamydomonas reinhardtii]
MYGRIAIAAICCQLCACVSAGRQSFTNIWTGHEKKTAINALLLMSTCSLMLLQVALMQSQRAVPMMHIWCRCTPHVTCKFWQT